ncbi:hypothetical protein [Bordetella pertussis]|uniref:hypothetical protein n=1 Tax=Bordetella pertussis TaxID=520 RepID=UPI0039B731CE
MFNKVTKTFQYGQHSVVLETGEMLARRPARVLVSVEDTVVLATVVAAKKARPARTFFSADRRLHREDLRRRPHPGAVSSSAKASPPKRKR